MILLSAQNPGSGRRRRYSAADYCKVAIMGRFARFGIPGGTAAHVAELIVSELVRRGEIEWQLHLAFRASRDDPNAFAVEIIVSNPLMTVQSDKWRRAQHARLSFYRSF